MTTGGTVQGGGAADPTRTESAVPPGSRSAAGAPAALGARLVSIGGGKGGVGKTFLVANLAVALARSGYRVVAVDGDLEGANLHTALGLQAPRVSLADFVAQREDDLGKLLVDTSVSGLQLVAGTHSNLGGAQPSHLRRVRLMRSLRQLRADFVIIDLGAGTHSSVLDYFLVGDEGIIALQPEPTSVENAYAFLRAAFYRRLRLAMVGHGVRKLVTLAMDQRNERGLRTPLELLREVEALDALEGTRFVETMRAFRPRFVVNAVRTAEDVKLGFAVCSVCRKYFGIEADYLGYVNYDDAARQSVAARRPVVDFDLNADAAIYLQRIARKLAAARDAELREHALAQAAAAAEQAERTAALRLTPAAAEAREDGRAPGTGAPPASEPG